MDEREYQQRISEILPSLYRAARSILNHEQDCADAVQEAVFQGWIKRGQLRNRETFKAWMMRITINECRNLQRTMMKQSRAEDAVITDLRMKPDPMREEDRSQALHEAVSELPEKYRLPIVLFYAEDYSTRAIAQMMGIPEGRLRERMHTARKMLRRMLGHESDE